MSLIDGTRYSYATLLAQVTGLSSTIGSLQSNPLPIYNTPANLPSSGTNGQIGIVLSTNSIWLYDSVWKDLGLKRTANDFTTFTLKTNPIATDVLLIEDSANGYAKRSISIGAIPIDGGIF